MSARRVQNPQPKRGNLIGEVREWLNRAVSKTVVPQGTVGSNPTLSANSRCCSSPKTGRVPLALPPNDKVIPFKKAPSGGASDYFSVPRFTRPSFADASDWAFGKYL
jgi:hypothetical protein